MKKLILIAAPLCLASSAFAQLSFTGTTLTENFDSLSSGGGWSDNTTLAGWYSNRTTIIYGIGSGNSGGLYSFGVAGVNPDTDRALGSLGSGSANPVQYAVAITNNSGAALLDMTISFRGEQWRKASTTVNTLSFAYKVGATTIGESGYTGVASLDFASPNNTSGTTALDGNASGNNTLLSDTVTFGVPVANGETVWLRWNDPDDSGSDQGISIDDFSFDATVDPVPEPATMTILAGAAAMAALRRRKK